MVIAAPAHAAEQAVRYSADWAGLPAADIALMMDDAPAVYRSEIRIASVGVPRWFTHFKTDVTVRGSVSPDGAIHPQRYDALYDLRKRHDRRISMNYVRQGALAVAERAPGDTSTKRQLPGFFRVNVVDPLSAMAAIRHRLMAHVPASGERFTVPVYDGARRFDVVARMQDPDPEKHLLKLRLELVPIAGFKGETSEDGDPDNAPRPVDAEFTADARVLPIYMRVSIAWLPFVVHFDSFCNGLAACAAYHS